MIDLSWPLRSRGVVAISERFSRSYVVMRPSADPASSFVPCVARQVTFWARWLVWFVSISGRLVQGCGGGCWAIVMCSPSQTLSNVQHSSSVLRYDLRE